MEIDTTALYIVNHSGGKDSQAMYLYLRNQIPAQNLVVIHADLPEVDWAGTLEHIQATINKEHELFVVRSAKTFFDMVNHRKMFPSSANRQCTSDLKRNPIEKKIKELCNTRGYTKVVNCMGLRADESANRKAKPEYQKSESKTNGKRTWFEWLPIHKWSEAQVFNVIATNGQKPHWAYAEGMTRLSCCFCIFSTKKDIQTAARLNPQLLQKYNELERKHNHTLIQPSKKNGKMFLTDIIFEQELKELEVLVGKG